MRKPSLTRQSKRSGNSLISTYKWRGHDVPVFDSARNGLLVIELFADEELEPEQKAELLPLMLFPNPEAVFAIAQDAASELLWDIAWEAFGIDITPDQSRRTSYEEPVFSWETDATRIRASFLQCYGIEWEDVATRYSYADACELLGAMIESESDTPFKEAVYYRTAKPPKRNKHNKELCESFEAKRSYFALEQTTEDKTRKANDVAADMFAAAKRAAQGAVVNG